MTGIIVQRMTEMIPQQLMRHFPFAHLVINDVLPQDIFRRASNALPSFETLSTQIKPETGQYNNRLVVPFDTLKTPADAEVWTAIESAMLSDEFEKLLINKFRDVMDDETKERFARPISRGLKLNCDPAGSYLKPHADNPEILLSFFIYLKSGSPHPSLNTALYEPLDAEARRQRITVEGYSHEEFTDHTRVGQIEFAPNRAFCFLRTWDSVHGIEPVAESAGPRYAISFRLKNLGGA